MKALLLALMIATSLPADELKWSQLPPIPDAEGFAASFAGVSNGALIVAGGANIVGEKWGETFTKKWYASAWMLPEPDGEWVKTDAMMWPHGYGVSVSTEDGLLCLGGSDEKGHLKTCHRLRRTGNRLEDAVFSKLPRACANACGALVGKTIYVAGGIETPSATTAMHTFWAFDVNNRSEQWREMAPWPGPARMLAVAAAHNGSFYLLGGTALSAGADGKPVREYLRDAYRFTPGLGWERLPDLPRPAVAAASPAPVKDGRIHVISGDDGANVTFQPVEKHPGFPRDTLIYDVRTNSWSTVPGAPFSRATVPVVEWRGRFVIPNGEVRPRVRTPEVWTLTLP